MGNQAPAKPDFEALFESAPDLYMILDPDLRIVAATDAYLRETKRSRADIGRYVFDVFPDNPADDSADSTRSSGASFRRVLETKATHIQGIQRHDIRRPESEGGGWEVRYWNAVNSPVLNPDGSVAYILHRVENVTELMLLKEQGAEQTRETDLLRAQALRLKAEIANRKRAEEETRESEERFRVLIQNLHSAVALVDERGAFSVVNRSFLRMFDIPQDADILNINSRNWSEWQVFSENGMLLDVDEHPVRRAALSCTPVRNQLVAVKSPSSPDLKWLLVSAEPVLDAQGKLHRLICTYYDVTRQKHAEDALRQSESVLRSFFDAPGDMRGVVEVVSKNDVRHIARITS